MSSDRFQQAAKLFLEAKKLARSERTAFLDRECAADEELRAEVLSLLEHDGEAGAFLETPSATVLDSEPATPALPERIGQYRVLSKLGEGGMGAVYLAEQEQPRRTVALKVLRPGTTSSDVRRRFRVEAEILGTLRHPGIAQVFEAGSAETPSGPLPYFAMELVEGEPLLDDARRRSLDTRQRLELVARIADAVEYAHEHGVIHRDLKPANILVDSSGNPKVLDFGVARITDADIRVTLESTSVGQIVGTLAYMSPEQAAGDSAKIDARSDVYALGVIAYELLSGRLPHDLRQKSVADAARELIESDITSLATIQSEHRGDVDTIVSKALEKERRRRYPTAAALASDIRRFLRDEPIVARPSSALYRLRKYARRHKGLAGGLAATFLVLLIGATVATVFAFREAEQRRAVERQLYRIGLQLAQTAIAMGDLESAAKQLERTEPSRRGWEWRYLRGRTEQTVAVWNAPRLYPTCVQLEVAIDPASQLVAAPATESNVSVRDLQSLEEVALIAGLESHPSVLEFSPDSRHIAIGMENGAIRIFESRSGRVVRSLESHTSTMQFLSYSPDGRRLASGSLDGTVRIWNTVDEESITPVRQASARLAGLEFSPDGSRLATGSWDRSVVVWDATSGELLQDLAEHRSMVRVVRWSPDGRFLVTAGKRVIVWDAASWERLAEERASALSAEFHPDGSTLAVAGQDGDVRIVGVPGGDVRQTIAAHQNWVWRAAFRPDGKRLVSSSADSTLRVWDTRNWKLQATLHGHRGQVDSLSFSRDGRWIASHSLDNTLRLWPGNLGESIDVLDHQKVSQEDLQVYSTAFSADGTWLATAAEDESVRLWHRDSGELMATFLGHEAPVHAVAVSPEGRLIVSASAGEDNSLRIWSRDSGAEVAPAALHPRGVTSLVFARDGSHVSSGSDDGKLRVFDVPELRLTGDVEAHSGKILSLASSADGQLLASASEDRTIGLWSGSSRASLPKLVRRLSGHEGAVQCVAFSPDGERLVSASRDRSLRLWDVQRGSEIAAWRSADDGVGFLACVFHPTEPRIASGGTDGSVRIWDAEEGEELLVLRGHRSRWPGYSFVAALDWSPDGELLASGSGDGTARMWSEAGLAGRLATALRSGATHREEFTRFFARSFRETDERLEARLVELAASRAVEERFREWQRDVERPATRWVPLESSSVNAVLADQRYRSRDGTITTEVPDHLLPRDVIVLVAPAAGRVRALRLEAFPDGDLSLVTLARTTSGSIGVREVALEVGRLGQADGHSGPDPGGDVEFLPHTLAGAAGDASKVVDRDLQTGWDFHSYHHAAVLRLEPPIAPPPRTVLRVKLSLQAPRDRRWAAYHSAGLRLRVLVTADEAADGETMLPTHIVDILRVPEGERSRKHTEDLRRFYWTIDPEVRGSMQSLFLHGRKKALFNPGDT